MKESDSKLVKVWKIVAGVVFAVLIFTSGYLTLKNDFIPSFDKWLSPVTVKNIEKSVYRPTTFGLLKAVNEERAKVGVAPLIIDERLNKSAQAKADDMKLKNYFGHTSPDGKVGNDFAHEAMPNCKGIDENITDSGEERYNTLDAGISAWINSPPHYNAMINPDYSLTGFGITSTGLVEHFCQLR